MSRARNRTVRVICAAFADGRLDPLRRSHVLAQLEAEGDRRVESFLFEHWLEELLRPLVDEERASLGWVFQPDGDSPRYWFRLLDASRPWNNCDENLADYLLSRRCEVLRVRYRRGEDSFVAVDVGKGSAAEQPLASLLREITGQPSPVSEPRDYASVNPARRDPAIAQVDSRFSDADLASLAISRLFTNCCLYPWFARQPMDIDAAFVREDG